VTPPHRDEERRMHSLIPIAIAAVAVAFTAVRAWMRWRR
jgi:hypothetical protein